MRRRQSTGNSKHSFQNANKVVPAVPFKRPSRLASLPPPHQARGIA
ncbi:hypothetical protein AWT69_003066 [Pseudomonas putida]|nr:hypothetical protein AWT69_003066 [Pseudomonas putida]